MKAKSGDVILLRLPFSPEVGDIEVDTDPMGLPSGQQFEGIGLIPGEGEPRMKRESTLPLGLGRPILELPSKILPEFDMSVEWEV